MPSYQTKSLSQDFQTVADAVGKTEDANFKVEIVHDSFSEHPVYLAALALAYNSKVEWNLPDGVPPYKVTDMGAADGMLKSAIVKHKIDPFLVGYSGNDKSDRKTEQRWINLLEAVTPDDALFLLAMSKGKLPATFSKVITKKLVSEAFPKETKNW